MKHIGKIYIIVSSVVITAIGLSYGLIPQTTMKALYGIPVSDGNLIYILRAVMGLYLAQAVFWLVSVTRGDLVSALRSQYVFLTGLILGRIVSLFIEGVPSFMLFLYLFGEMFFLVVNRFVFSRHRDGRVGES